MNTWLCSDVVGFCCCHNYYTRGDVEAYNKMLDYVRANRHPGFGDIKKVAIDIVCHSDGISIFDDTAVLDMMVAIFNEVVVKG